MKHCSILAILCAFFATSISSFAITIIPYKTIETQAQDSEIVVAGVVTKVEKVTLPSGLTAFEYTMVVSDTLVGSTPSKFRFHLYRRRDDDVSVTQTNQGYRRVRRYVATPTIEEGFEGVLFLSSKRRRGQRVIIGSHQGVYRFEKDPDGERQVKNLLGNKYIRSSISKGKNSTGAATKSNTMSFSTFKSRIKSAVKNGNRSQ